MPAPITIPRMMLTMSQSPRCGFTAAGCACATSLAAESMPVLYPGGCLLKSCNLSKAADTTSVKRLFAVLLAMAVIWPQVVLPYPAKEPACTKCQCSMLCCSSELPAEPLAIPATSTFSSVQWTVPQEVVLFNVPDPTSNVPAHAKVVPFQAPVPLFLRNCAQLI